MSASANRITASVVLLLLVAVFATLATAQTIPSVTRTTAYDWRCEGAGGERISDHQRFDTAFLACLNASNGRFVVGGRYEIQRPVVPAPEPTPTPTPTPSPPGSATLTWDPPAQNTNGSLLTNLSGYRIVYGTSPTELSKAVQVARADARDHVMIGLTPGTWYFAVIALSASGSESDPSNVVTKVVR